MKTLKYWLLTAALLLPVTTMATEMGTALKTDSMRAEPYADAKTTGNFARSDKLEILTKQGAWLKVKTARTTGWVRLLSVKRGNLAKSNGAAGVLGLASGRAGTGQVVATTGVRGLGEEDLKAAKFNKAEIKALEANTVSVEQGQQFASTASLKALQLPYLPKPGSAEGGAK